MNSDIGFGRMDGEQEALGDALQSQGPRDPLQVLGTDDGSSGLSTSPAIAPAHNFPVEPSDVAADMWKVNMESYDLPSLTFADKQTAHIVSNAMNRLVRAIYSDLEP